LIGKSVNPPIEIIIFNIAKYNVFKTVINHPPVINMFIGGIRLPFPGLGGWIREDALPLGELLADIRHQTPSVAQGELVGHVVVDEVVVAFNLSH
jgi:hypothetical protein